MSKNKHLAPTSYAEQNWGKKGTKYHLLFLNLRKALPKNCKLSVARMYSAVYFLENYFSNDSEGIDLVILPVCGHQAMKKRIKRLCIALRCSNRFTLNAKLNELLNQTENCSACCS